MPFMSDSGVRSHPCLSTRNPPPPHVATRRLPGDPRCDEACVLGPVGPWKPGQWALHPAPAAHRPSLRGSYSWGPLPLPVCPGAPLEGGARMKRHKSRGQGGVIGVQGLSPAAQGFGGCSQVAAPAPWQPGLSPTGTCAVECAPAEQVT